VKRRVVVTGLGAITPIGSGSRGLYEGLRREWSAIDRITRFDASPFSSQIAGEVRHFDAAAYLEPKRPIGEAFRTIRDGYVDVTLAGGVEAPLTPLIFGAFTIIRAMSTRNEDPARACRPFDRGRDGFVMAEGAALLVLEELEHGRLRGASMYGEILGFGSSNDAHHMTAPLPSGAQAARAMRCALSEAGVTPEAIGYVNAHASSTPHNDVSETLAIKQVFGEHAYRVPISGTKAMHGHALGATGAIEAAICMLAFRHTYLPPTINLEEPDPDCDLDYIPRHGRELAADYILSNSFGFGGINASLVFGQAPA
jgi:3-oxoacyl-[acyl-carrier-protein] synthase II